MVEDRDWVLEAGGGHSPVVATLPLDDDWEGHVVIGWDDEHRVVLRSLELRPRHDGVPLGGITTSVWRAAFSGELLDSARRLFVEAAEIVLEVPEYDWRAPGAAGHPDEAYAIAAYLYRAATLTGSRSPVEDIAKSMGCTRATASTRLAEARKRGLLTGASHGRSGGRLTTKAKRLLEIQNAEVF